MKKTALLAMALLMIVAVGCQPNGPPKIRIVSASFIGDPTAQAWGYVLNAPPYEYGVAVYILVRGEWWTKPYWDSPITPLIGPFWICEIVTGGVDIEATKVRAYLWKLSDGNPPSAGGSAEIPISEDVPVSEIERK